MTSNKVLVTSRKTITIYLPEGATHWTPPISLDDWPDFYKRVKFGPDSDKEDHWVYYSLEYKDWKFVSYNTPAGIQKIPATYNLED